MKCRSGCAACCTVISISSPLPGMPEGKPPGVRCINLDNKNRCKIHNSSIYPDVCMNFTADKFYCGNTDEEAYYLINKIEQDTKPEI